MSTPTMNRTVNLPAGVKPSQVTCRVRLVANVTRDAHGYVTGGTVIGGIATQPVNPAGAVSFLNMVPNSTITPANTVYELVTKYPDGRAVPEYFTVPNGAGPYNISDHLADLPSDLPSQSTDDTKVPLDGSGTMTAPLITPSLILTGGLKWLTCTATPEGQITAPVGSLCTRTDGGTATTLYVKESGAGDTGWAPAGGSIIAAAILAALITVDGASSGLDADLLDGHHGSYFTGYTDTAIANLIGSAPGILDTLGEIATAINNDAALYTTLVGLINGKQTASAVLTALVSNGTPGTTGLALILCASQSAARTALGLGTVSTLAFTTAGTLAGNSDSNVPTEKAVKTYVDAHVPTPGNPLSIFRTNAAGAAVESVDDPSVFDDSPNLRGWHVGIARALTGLGDAKVVVLGTSEEALTSFIYAEQMVSAKMNKYIHTPYVTGWTAPFSTFTPWHVTGSAGTNGLANFGSSLAVGQTDYVAAVCDQLTWYYTKQTAGGANAQVYIDGVLATTINTTGTAGGGYSYSTGVLNYGYHELRVTAAGSGTVLNDGCFLRPGPGVNFYTAGHSGWGDTEFHASQGTIDHLTRNPPDLVICSAIINDRASSVSAATALLSTVLSDVATAAPLASRAVVFPWQPFDQSDWAQRQRSVRELCRSLSVPFWDIYAELGDVGDTVDNSATGYALSGDGIHGSTLGNGAWSWALAKRIVPAYGKSQPSVLIDGSVPSPYGHALWRNFI